MSRNCLAILLLTGFAASGFAAERLHFLIPGGAGATAFDGYPLARRGQAGKALAIAAYSSFAGGTIGAVLILAFVPFLAKVSLSFQSADYFALMLFGCTAIAAENLSLYQNIAAQFFSGAFGFGGRIGHLALRHADTVLGEDLLRLELVEMHIGRLPPE